MFTVIMVASLFSCGGSDPDSKYILSFLIDDQVGIVSETEVLVVMPYGSDLTSLTPTITLSEGNTVSPESAVAQDFTNPVTYTVTAEDDSTKEYSVTAKVYEVGDTGPAGGIIFYGDTNYGTYFEAAPSDQTGTSAWSNIDNTEIDLAAAKNSSIGTGASNTIAITDQAGHTNSAAKKCFDLSLGGKSDWFLPSYRELESLYTNKAIIGGFADAIYWSSSEFDANNASAFDFLNGGGASDAKGNAFRVRCIRSF